MPLQTHSNRRPTMFRLPRMAALAGAPSVPTVPSVPSVPSAPSVPTVVRSGLPGFEYSAWVGVFAPAAKVVREAGIKPD